MPYILRPPSSFHLLRPLSINPNRPFHTTPHFRASPSHLVDSANQDHYDILGVAHGASAADIKRQFYTLSKLHHPDRNPTDPTASSRFLAISEAYHVLSSPEKRAHYDRTFRPAQSSQHIPRGSFSSASRGSPVGARPASGLSRRRGQFRGPPASFYRNGGYGAHGAKRSANASAGSGATGTSEAGSNSTTSSSTGGAAGMGPGTHPTDYSEPFIPYWDREGHFRTHEGIRQRAASRSEQGRKRADDEISGNANMVLQFFAVSGIVLFSAVVIPSAISSYSNKKTRKESGVNGAP